MPAPCPDSLMAEKSSSPGIGHGSPSTRARYIRRLILPRYLVRGHHLLSCITSFGKTDSIYQMHVCHLWQKALRCTCVKHGYTGEYSPASNGHYRKALPIQPVFSTMQSFSRVANNRDSWRLTWMAQQCESIDLDCIPRLSRYLAELIMQQCLCTIPDEPNTHQPVTCIGHCHPGSENEHWKTLKQNVLGILRHLQHYFLLVAEGKKAGQHSTFGVAAGADVKMVAGQVAYIVGYLSLQKVSASSPCTLIRPRCERSVNAHSGRLLFSPHAQ